MEKYSRFNISNTADINVGLIGAGIQESRSPLMHMQEASAQGIKLDYQLFDLDLLDEGHKHLPDLLETIEKAGYAGLNITHPCKQSIIDYLDALSPDARELGAVNTVSFHSGKRYGYNTDWQGFYLSFNKSFQDINTDKVLLLGAGGAGSAVAYALAKSGVKSLQLFDLDETRVNTLITRLSRTFEHTSFKFTPDIKSAMTLVDGVVNTTPVGMKKYPGMPIPANTLTARHWLADVIYFPLETELLKTARNTGCQTMDGSGMAINQAAEAFTLFTGKKADTQRMAHTFFNAFD